MIRFIILFSALCFLFSLSAPSSAQDKPKTESSDYVAKNISRFEFKDWAGPEIPVYIFKPANVDLTEAPILMMMHGAGRGAERYLKEWVPYAQEKGVIVVAPLFSKEDFPRSRGYNLGNIHKRNGKVNKEAKWSFSAIEPLFDYVVDELESDQSEYTLYGHSAGSQFVHRFLYYKPEARVKKYLAANAGWYTLPNAEAYPYGLKDAGVTLDMLKTALSKDVIILLGDQDVDSEHRSLRKTEEAMRQGEHRYARGFHFEHIGKKQAANLNVSFGWQSKIVTGVAHSNGGIAKEAINFID